MDRAAGRQVTRLIALIIELALLRHRLTRLVAQFLTPTMPQDVQSASPATLVMERIALIQPASATFLPAG